MQQFTNRFFQDEQGKSFSVEKIQSNMLLLVAADLYSILSKTDWQVTRANDPTSQKPITTEVLNERQSAREYSEFLVSAIESAKTVEALYDIYINNLGGDVNQANQGA